MFCSKVQMRKLFLRMCETFCRSFNSTESINRKRIVAYGLSAKTSYSLLVPSRSLHIVRGIWLASLTCRRFFSWSHVFAHGHVMLMNSWLKASGGFRPFLFYFILLVTPFWELDYQIVLNFNVYCEELIFYVLSPYSPVRSVISVVLHSDVVFDCYLFFIMVRLLCLNIFGV